MCGLLGYTDSNITALKKAHALQCHRGPDDSGFYDDEHICLGHNRLSIIDLNERSAQPMSSANSRYTVVFNGEIYNYQELKIQLQDSYKFTTESDTEVLLALYTKYGNQLCEHIRGMYAFAIYDKEENTVTLFRDPFGIKPLYYAFVTNKLFFTSELKTMVSLFGSYQVPLELDKENISVYLTLGYTISPGTIYRNIQLLLPGHFLRFNTVSRQAPTISKILPAANKNLTGKEYMDLVEERVLSNLVADVPIGVFFSGGTDSSLIAAILHKHEQDLETFSIKVEGRDSDSPYFTEIAKYLNLKNTTYIFDTEAFDSIYEEVVKKLDNPSGSNGIFQTYYIAKKASEKVKVVLMGDGGDELFYGYPRSLPLYKMSDYSVERGKWLEQVYFTLPSFKAKNLIFLKLSELLKLPLTYYLNQMSMARDLGSYESWQICRKKILERATSPNHFDCDLYLSDNLLFKSDAATSYCSIEGRVPFLDEDILSNSEQFAKLSITKNVLKYFPKKILSAYLPEHLVYRKKSGFGINYKNVAKESQFIQTDFDASKKLLLEIVPNLKLSQTVNGQYKLIIVCLYYSIKNNRIIYDGLFSST